MMGVDSGNMLTPSVLISTETEDGQASKAKNVFHASEKKTVNKIQSSNKLGHFKLATTHWLKKRGEAGCEPPLTAQQKGDEWSDHTRPPLARRCMTMLLNVPGGEVVWLEGVPLLAALLGCWM